jgi:hypothetical protein
VIKPVKLCVRDVMVALKPSKKLLKKVSTKLGDSFSSGFKSLRAHNLFYFRLWRPLYFKNNALKKRNPKIMQ